MTSPAVTIVVPTRDRAGWLPRALDSVLAQDYDNFELLVVDDGSQDGTRELLDRYARSLPAERFRYVSQPRMGQASAVNSGWAIARGEILGYLADDDAILPSALSRLVGALSADSQAAVAYPAYRIVDEKGDVVNSVLPLEYSPETAICLHDTIIGPGALLRRSVLERAGGWDPSFHWQVDLILWMRIGLQGRAVRVPEILALWTRHAGATTLTLCTEHAREHVRAAEFGLALPGLGPLSHAARAEAMRNACIEAAIFEGPGQSWPGDQYVVVDFLRPAVFGFAAHGDPEALPGEAGPRRVALWRELSAPVAQPAGAGTEAGLERLQASAGLSGAALRIALLEAAIDFGADVDPREARFAIFRAGTASKRFEQVALRALFGFPVAAVDLEALRGASVSS